MRGSEFKRVLVALKPWQRGLPLAAAHARALAQGFEGQLKLVSCVFDSQVAARLELRETSAFAAQAGMLERERVDLERLAQSLRDWGAAVDTRVLWDAPAYQGALRAAREWQADLLVVGAHERHPALRTRLTDTDWQLMRQCPCPLLMVKEPSFDGYPVVLAAVDPLHEQANGTDEAVLAAAREFSRAFRSTLRAVHAFPDPESFALVTAVQVEPGVFYGTENIEPEHRRAVDDLLSRVGLEGIEVDFAPGEPAAVIVDTVAKRHVKLLVLGALRRSRLEQAILGGTAEAVAADVPCDLLLIPRPEVERGRATTRPAGSRGATLERKTKTKTKTKTKRKAKLKGKAKTARPRRRSAS
jgi:universal stress protein E